MTTNANADRTLTAESGDDGVTDDWQLDPAGNSRVAATASADRETTLRRDDP